MNLFYKFLENGTNILALLGLMGYFVKRFFDLKSKKVEIKYNLFHAAKLKAMMDFQSAFTSLHSDFDIAFNNIVSNTINKNQFETSINPKLSKYYASHDNLRFFINDLQIPWFDDSKKNIQNIYTNIFKFLVESGLKFPPDVLQKQIKNLQEQQKFALDRVCRELYDLLHSTYRKEFETDNSLKKYGLDKLKKD